MWKFLDTNFTPLFQMETVSSLECTPSMSNCETLSMTRLLKNEFKGCEFRHLFQPSIDGNIFKKLSIFSRVFRFSLFRQKRSSVRLSRGVHPSHFTKHSLSLSKFAVLSYIYAFYHRNKDVYEKTLLEGCVAFTAAAFFNRYQRTASPGK